MDRKESAAVKEFKPFGVSVKADGYKDASEARGHTYTTSDDQFPSTNLACIDNPYISDVLNAKNILDVGCGVGRNLPWIMENTQAHYWGLDPNESMLKYFWELQDKKWESRVTLINEFPQFGIVSPYGCVRVEFDVVVSTLTFQHIGYMAPETHMNVSDITTEIRKFTKDGTVWFLFEHEREDGWILRWAMEQGFYPLDLWLPNYIGLPELTHRGTDHNLIIHKEKR